MQVDHYELHERLGEGGAGQVYRARDTRSGREFAVKVLHDRPDPTGANLRRFQRETAALAALSHPNLVRIFGSGTHKGVRYLVMDLIDGESVEDRVARSGPLTPAEAAGVARIVAGALQHVHDAGLIHRDLKPANVMLSRDGTPYLSDFGLVKDLDPELTRLTLSGVLVGTPGYWAPELASGHPEQATSRTDVYGLGAFLYGALTGEPPLNAASLIELLAATHVREVDPPSKHNPAVDSVLDAIVLRCLRKAPEDRYPSALAVGQDLDAYLRGDLGDVTATGRRKSKPAQPLPLGIFAIAGSTVLAVFMILAALFAPSAPPVAPAKNRATPAPSATPSTPTPGPSAHSPSTTPPPNPPPLDPTPVTPLPAGREPPRPQDAKVRELLDAAAKAQTENRRVEAIELAQQGVDLAPQSPWLQFVLGNALFATGDLWGARRAFSKTIELAPDWSAPHYNRGLCLTQEKQYAAALADFDEALRLDPRSGVTFQERALTHMRLGNLGRALEDVSSALRLSPGDARAHHNLGVVLARMNHKLEALDAFSESIRIDPLFAQSYLRRGSLRLELRLGDPSEGALSDLDRALKLEPELSTARYGRGTLYASLGRLKEAETDLDLAARALSTLPDVFLALGQVRSRLKRYKDAERAFSRAVTVSPKPRLDIYRARGLTRSERKNYRGALEDFESALRLDPDRGEILYQRALMLMKLKEWTRARHAFTRAISAGQRTQWAYNGRGYVLLELKEHAAALADFEQAAALDPTRATIIYNCGLAKARLGRHAEAIVDFDRASALDPDYAKSYSLRAESRLALGDERGALSDMDSALALDPKHLSTRRQRGLLRAKLGDRSGAKEDFEHYLRLSSKGSRAEEVRNHLAELDSR